MVTVQLSYKNNRSRYFEMLLDSGADFTLIPKSLAALLGIEYKALMGEEIKVEVANLTFIHTKKTKISMKIDDIQIQVPVLISNEEVECLLGRNFREKGGF